MYSTYAFCWRLKKVTHTHTHTILTDSPPFFFLPDFGVDFWYIKKISFIWKTVLIYVGFLKIWLWFGSSVCSSCIVFNNLSIFNPLGPSTKGEGLKTKNFQLLWNWMQEAQSTLHVQLKHLATGHVCYLREGKGQIWPLPCLYLLMLKDCTLPFSKNKQKRN